MPGDDATNGVVSADDLRTFCVNALTKVGVGEVAAQTTADVLVTTDTWGVFTHGVKGLHGYIRRIKAGGIRADARPRVTAEGPGWAIVDGDSALGMVASTFAMRAAIAKARACGVGYAGVFNSCHFGAAGYYAAMAAAEDMIGLAMANDAPSVTAPGARGRVTGSNPLAYAVPSGSGMPILLDMATSTVAGGKVSAAHVLGKLIPGGWVVDVEGRPTTDPAAFLAGGALTPMAGHKGYGLALLIEILAAVLTGAAVTRQVVPWIVGDPSIPTEHGAAFLAVNIAAMMPIDQFKRRVDALAREIRESPLAEGADRVYLPGEIEWERRKTSLAEGILLPEDVRLSVAALSRELGIAALKSGSIEGPIPGELRP
jgi:LDH2 family malate/lactate/ureidoglycolate dehydrogenase